MLTGNKNLDYKILNELNDKDLVSVCEVNKKANEICRDQIFWLNRIRSKYPFISPEILNKYRRNRKWSDYYIELTKSPDIFESVRMNREDFVLIEIDKGNINIQNQFFQTPLMKATQKGELEMVKLLIENRADVDIQDSIWLTPLLTAASRGFLEIVKLLVENGADINHKTIGGAGILFLTIVDKRPSYELVKYLLDNGAEINNRTREGNNPLTYAERQNLYEIVPLLKEYGGVN